MAKLREEPDSDEGSSLDEGVPGKMSGHCGKGEPMKVGVGYTQRDFCDGQSLASTGRWAPGCRVDPSSESWKLVADCYRRSHVIMALSSCWCHLQWVNVDGCPFPLDDVANLKHELIDIAAGCGFWSADSTVLVPMEVDQTRAVPGFHSGTGSDGKGKAKGKGKSKRARKARSRDSRTRTASSRDTADTAKSGDTNVPTAGSASPTASRRVVQQLHPWTMTARSKPLCRLTTRESHSVGASL